MLIFDRQGRFAPLKAAALLLACLPGLWLGYGLMSDTLGPKPIEALLHETGRWSLRLLLVTLAITPFRLITGWGKLLSIRRILGVSALAYLLVHAALYCVDQKFEWLKIGSEIVLRFYLSVGFLALLIMAALGATSFDAAIRRMGAARWNRLHALIYPLAVLALWHAALQAKLKVSEPVVLAGLFVALMLVRLMRGRVGLTVLPLLGLALLSAPITAGIEYAWYALATKIPGERVLGANFLLALAPRPALVTALIVLTLPLAALAKRWKE
jgi:methionine sulfoxide reductase heme-binding subunit